MKRALVGIAVVVGVALAVVVLAMRCGGGADAPTRAATDEMRRQPPRTAPPPVDPRTLARGGIAGTIRDEEGAPIGNAQVCARGESPHLEAAALHEPICALADAMGRYRLALLPARYVVDAAAPRYRPTTYAPSGRERQTPVLLGAGAEVTGIDLVLRPGGVLLAGTVSDMTGGPVVGARVVATGGWRSTPGAAVAESNAAGRYEVWVAPGTVEVIAYADGYADGTESGRAPGSIDVLLSPEGSLTGTVVDAATGQPVEGARVTLGESDFFGGEGLVFSDAQGVFRIAKLEAGRHAVVARTVSGYGRTAGSTLVALGQHVRGIVVPLHPAVRVSGRIVIAPAGTPCPGERSVSLHHDATDRWVTLVAEPDGTMWADGVRPGHYRVSVACEGHMTRDRYPSIDVGDRPLSGLVWEVELGAKIRGRVLTRRGEPVEGAAVWARSQGGAARTSDRFGEGHTDRTGNFELAGLAPGTYKLDVHAAAGHGPREGFRVVVPATGDATVELVVEDGGTISGTVVDEQGRPVPGTTVTARALDGMWGTGDGRTDAAGAFTIESVRPGAYRVIATRGGIDELRKPGSTDDTSQGERATVRAGATSTVQLVVEALTGTIRGQVVDAAGEPVADAFVTATRESDAAGALRTSAPAMRWRSFERPVVTGTDGSFVVEQLGPGRYTVRAQRRGGGEAIAEHVELGATARLQIHATASIAGTVRTSGELPDEIKIVVREVATGRRRQETFFRSGGAFTVTDLAAGKLQVTVEAEGAGAALDLELREGEARTGLALELEPPVTIVGRVIELGTTTPVPGIMMSATRARGGGAQIATGGGDERRHITDDTGAFELRRAPRGQVVLRGWTRDPLSPFAVLTAIRQIDGAGTVDVGTLHVVRRRVRRGEPIGELGINFAEQPRDTPPDRIEYKVSWIDPAGPAARTALRVGDVITLIDGHDITGGNSGLARALLQAPPGAKLTLGLARSVNIVVTLGAP